MRQGDFKKWMRRAGFDEMTIESRMGNCTWIEEHLNEDLDECYATDRGAAVFERLSWGYGEPNPLVLEIDGDVFTQLSMYRGAARLYFEFCSGGR